MQQTNLKAAIRILDPSFPTLTMISRLMEGYLNLGPEALDGFA